MRGGREKSKMHETKEERLARYKLKAYVSVPANEKKELTMISISDILGLNVYES